MRPSSWAAAANGSIIVCGRKVIAHSLIAFRVGGQKGGDFISSVSILPPSVHCGMPVAGGFGPGGPATFSKSSWLHVMRLAVSLLVVLGCTDAQAQYPWGYERDRRDRRDDRYDRNDRYDRYGLQNARQQGYSYGLSTGAADAQRGQSYNPQRSRYWRNPAD